MRTISAGFGPPEERLPLINPPRPPASEGALGFEIVDKVTPALYLAGNERITAKVIAPARNDVPSSSRHERKSGATVPKIDRLSRPLASKIKLDNPCGVLRDSSP